VAKHVTKSQRRRSKKRKVSPAPSTPDGRGTSQIDDTVIELESARIDPAALPSADAGPDSQPVAAGSTAQTGTSAANASRDSQPELLSRELVSLPGAGSAPANETAAESGEISGVVIRRTPSSPAPAESGAVSERVPIAPLAPVAEEPAPSSGAAGASARLWKPQRAAPSAAVPRPIVRAVSVRARLLVALAVVVACLATLRTYAGASREATLERSLAHFLERKQLRAEAAQVVWLESGPNWLGVRPTLFVAQRARELHDVYFADVRVSGTAVVDVYNLTNITRSSSADEDRLIGLGRGATHAAYAARVGSTYDALVVLDTRGESARLTQRWPWYAKLQNAVSNLQDTGRFRAFGVRRYLFEQPADRVALSVVAGHLMVRADAQSLLIDPARSAPLTGADRVEVEDIEKGQPGLITWVVDTVRRVPWIGRAPVEWLEHTVFGITDRANRVYHGMVRTDTAAEVKQALAVTELPQAPRAATTRELSQSQFQSQSEPEESIAWPPPGLVPQLPDAVQGEGVWLAIQNDPFVGANPSAPPLFHQTFIRVDPVRSFTRVYVTLWDPRQVQLGMVMGTKEPESATGETGNGMIPRDPYVLSHLVAGFNGGFQATHGEFGMMAERRVYLPPKPFAATVAVFEDGRTGLGSWPGPGRHAWDESFANSQIPQGMVAMRQNLTSVVEDDAFNPWKRWWWGAAPTWAEEQTFIPRSGLCLTGEGYLAYFWGESMGPEELGKAMLATRCVRGMHLDMNGKHTGLEFYKPYLQTPAPLGRELRSSEFDGPGFETRGVRFRARLAVTTMSPLRFPRYLQQDPRDYFYLMRKPILPGGELEYRQARVALTTAGLPSSGFPHAFARAALPGGGTLVRIDPSRAVPRAVADASLARPLAHLTEAGATGAALLPGAHVLYAKYSHGRLRAGIGALPAGATALLSGPRWTPESVAVAALGVDGEGFLVYVEAPSAGDLALAFQAASVVDAIALSAGALVFSTDAGPARVDGQPAAAVDEAQSLTFMAETRAPAEVLFRDVEPLPYRKWGWMQDQRVRYFPSGKPSRFQAPEWAR
jgi:hypothetical protein